MFINRHAYKQKRNSSYKSEWLIISDSSEGAHNGTGSTPVAVSPVFSGFQEVLSSSVVGIFIENPVAIHHITGVHVAMVKTVRHTGAVVCKFHHVTTVVSLLIDPQSVWSSVLLRIRKKRFRTHTRAKKKNSQGHHHQISSQKLTAGIMRQDRTVLLKPIHLWYSGYSPLFM